MDTRQIKVLEIITLFSIGGATETVVTMAEGLNKRGFLVDIATGPNIKSEGSMYEVAKKMGIKVYTFNHLVRKINFLIDFRVVIQLAAFIKKNRYEIVHTHSSKAGVLGRLAAVLAGAKVVIHTIHGLPFHRYQKRNVNRLFIFAEKLAACFCDKLIAVTHTIKEIVIEKKIAKENKVVVIRSAFNLDEFLYIKKSRDEIRKKYNFESDDIIIGKIARLSELKGHKYLFEAFVKVAEIVPNAKLLIVGNGELEADLKLFTKEAGLFDRVIFTGLVLPEDIPAIINSIDILVHSSLLEGLARVLPQSIMLCKPTISFDLDGAHEVIKDGINGYLIPPLDTKMMAERITELCLNPAKAKQFGEIGKRLVGDSFSDNKMIEEIFELYNNLYH